MSQNLTGNYFTASRGFYGTNSLKYKNMEIEVTKYNHDHTNPVTSFDWGNTNKGSHLLAYAILSTIATPSVARIYANKYMQQVIEKLKKDEWKIEALEVAKWINENTNYTIHLSNEKDISSKKQIDEQPKNTIKNTTLFINDYCKELQIQEETLAKILDISVDIVNSWKQKNEIPKLALKAMEFYRAGRALKEQNTRFKIDIKQLQEELVKNQTQITLAQSELSKYKKFINTLDMPNLYKIYKDL